MPTSTKTELTQLRSRINDADIPVSKSNNLRLLTWNIRNFNKDKEDKAITYIAEVIKNFDVIAIQECKDSLGGIEKLQKVLGKKYRFLFSDSSGNSERLVFCYDSEKVEFTGLAAEIVMSPGSGRTGVKAELEFDRTPYMASFRSNGCNFCVVTVHIYYGSGSSVKYRKQEIANVAKRLKETSKDTDALDSDYIVCGDFNIEDTRSHLKEKGAKEDPLDGLFDALLSGGIIIPDDIRNSPSNLAKNKHFDQIGFHKYKDSTLEYIKGGVIDFVGAVYVNDPKLKYKLTDHLPMWAVFKTSKDKNPKFINP